MGENPVDHDPGGPTALARVVLERRAQLEGGQLRTWLTGNVPDQRVTELVRIAYEVSFKKDEGRYPRFVLVAPSVHESRLYETAAVCFDPPTPLNVRTLRRLASAVPPRPHSLLVKENEGELCCTGIGRFETPGAFMPDDQTGLFLGAEGLVIEVSGPGDLTVSEAQEVNSLKAGRIVPEHDGARALDSLGAFANARARLLERHLPGGGAESSDKVRALVHDLWIYVLSSAVSLAHGGAFAVLPDTATSLEQIEEPWIDQIDVTYATSGPDLLAFLGRYAAHRWGVGDDAAGRREALFALWDAALSVSRLSATDGFVLLSEDLSVLGFGARIGWDEPLPADCPEVDSRLAPTGARFDLARAGLRHAAAYRICRAVPGTLLFIVSQDSELRIFFAGDDGEVRVTAPLSPAAYLFQGL